MVIQVTRNGTRGTFAVGDVPAIVCASFVTAGATVRTLESLCPDRLVLVPTESDEDTALADFLATTLTLGTAPDPAPFLARVEASAAGKECAT